MVQVKINYQALKLAIDKPVERAFRQAAVRIANERFDDAKEVFLEEFLTHPVSQEIEEGPRADGGVLPTRGNLFGFIGFNEGETPVEDLYHFLEDHIYITKIPTYDKVRQRYNFNVYAPSKEAIKDVTPMPWGTAKSWVYAIEGGLAGLNHYLFSEKRNLGRSTGGIQVKGELNDAGGFKNRKYLTDLMNQFIRNLK